MKTSNLVLFLTALALLILTGISTYTVLPKKSNAVIQSFNDKKTENLSFVLPENLSSRQTKVLSMAYDIAKKDGHKYPQLLQGIVLQESNAGDLASYKVAGQEFGLKPNERYYGVSQIKLVAAKEVLHRYPGLHSDFKFHTKSDEEIIAKLIENDEFNINIASKYLLVLKDMGYDTIKQLALAYNQGPSGAKKHDAETHYYTRGVINHIQRIHKKQN